MCLRYQELGALSVMDVRHARALLAARGASTCAASPDLPWRESDWQLLQHEISGCVAGLVCARISRDICWAGHDALFLPPAGPRVPAWRRRTSCAPGRPAGAVVLLSRVVFMRG